MIRFLIIALSVLALAGCAGRANDQGANATSPGTTPAQGVPASTCTPTDQDQYVWRPARLPVLRACLRAAGTVTDISPRGGADGDIHLNLRLDEPYQPLLVEGNKENEGYLVVEVICESAPVQPDAIRICAADTDPYSGLVPRVGDHVWMEGRYVLDLEHHSWAELHPLYRWGYVNP